MRRQMTAKEITEALDIDVQIVINNLEALEKKGLVRRVDNSKTKP